MIFIGINGFGRIGKCVFLQLIQNPHVIVKAINAPDFDIEKIEFYLKNDSVHKYDANFSIEVVDNCNFKLNGRNIHVFNNRNASELRWTHYNISHVIDSTGVYLTSEKAKDHDVDYVIMSAPPKDDTPIYVYGANHRKYNNENIISNASCTTNCIVPVLKHLNDTYGIKQANFTTIHASTSSQKVVDTPHSKSRTNRTIFNNIIPHSTGASSSIFKILPELENKIVGTSVRIPINNVSLVDLNVELLESTDLENIFKTCSENPYLQIVNNNCVSSDFISSQCPSIIDKKASLELGNNQFKLMVWYDNEWSYASQLIELVKITGNYNINPFFIDKQDFKDKEVVLRLDLNVPITNGAITNDYRITSSLETINRILKDHPKRLLIMSHLGRPNEYDEKLSLKIVKPVLEKYLNTSIEFLGEGLVENTLVQLEKSENKVFLLENLRFHQEETQYKTMRPSVAEDVMQKLGNCYVNDAFGCLHRDHLSINGVNMESKSYGYLVNNELEILTDFMYNGSKVLAIIGGGKMDDKLKMMENLSKKVDHIFIAGGNINSILKDNMQDYIEKISSNKAKITCMEDGFCAESLESSTFYCTNENLPTSMYYYDIGLKSINILQTLIDSCNTIFWNGTLGVVENINYKQGSEMLVNMLKNTKNKNIIVGGGDTGGFVSNYDHNFNHVSTGGGATIEYITNDNLVGLFQFMK